MRPDQDDLDEEIRAALKEFGNVTLTRDSMRGVWRHRLPVACARKPAARGE